MFQYENNWTFMFSVIILFRHSPKVYSGVAKNHTHVFSEMMSKRTSALLLAVSMSWIMRLFWGLRTSAFSFSGCSSAHWRRLATRTSWGKEKCLYLQDVIAIHLVWIQSFERSAHQTVVKNLCSERRPTLGSELLCTGRLINTSSCRWNCYSSS